MAKHQQVAQKNEEFIDVALKEATENKVAIEDMPLNSIRDYRLYNEEARKINKKLKMVRYQIKQCPAELHPKQRIKIDTTNGSRHPIPVFLSNHNIHFDEKLIPGKVYDLPECVVDYLTSKGNPIWGWVNLPDGSKETRQIDKTPRFTIVNVRQDD